MSATEEKKTGVVSQEDIDRLLGQDESVFEETDALAEPSDETLKEIDPAGDVDALLRDIPKVSDASDEEDPFDENDPFAEAQTDSVDGAAEETPDRVILEDVPGEQTPKSRKSVLFTWKPGKWHWVCLVTIGAIGGSWIFLGHFTQKSTPLPEPIVLTFPIVPEPKSSATPTFIESSYSVFMKGFIVPAPPKRDDFIFVATDIGLELTTAKAATVVKDHIPFFRSIIYDVLLNTLKSMDKSKINSITLRLAVMQGLAGALPERSIKNVIVDTFKIYE
jgi:hypothetical protein